MFLPPFRCRFERARLSLHSAALVVPEYFDQQFSSAARIANHKNRREANISSVSFQLMHLGMFVLATGEQPCSSASKQAQPVRRLAKALFLTSMPAEAVDLNRAVSLPTSNELDTPARVPRSFPEAIASLGLLFSAAVCDSIGLAPASDSRSAILLSQSFL